MNQKLRTHWRQFKNPFENSESVFLSTDSRATTRRKRERKDGYKGVHKYRSKRINHDRKEDPDIQREIDKGLTVNFL